jgi:hypothetical protein
LLGHILMVSADDNHSALIAEWTTDWLNTNGIPIDKTIYICCDPQLASSSLQVPVQLGNPPSLVILDHGNNGDAMHHFSELLHDCIPECWIIDLIDPESMLPKSHSAFIFRKPVKKEDWEDVLQHIYLLANSPQWSNALIN